VKYPVTRDDQESLLYPRRFSGYAFLPWRKRNRLQSGWKNQAARSRTGTENYSVTAQVSQELGPKLDFPQTLNRPVKAR